jgi:hypothetical protein
MIKIALDVDDVLAAFTPHAHDFHEMPMCETLDYWCVPTMDARLGQGWFMEHIAPVHEFWRTIPRLSNPEDIDFEVAYYISAFPEDMHDIRLNWLREHGFPEAPLICCSDKLAKCIELGVDVLVDDKPATIEKLKGSPVKGIHFLPYYAGFAPVGEHVITNLNQIKNHI